MKNRIVFFDRIKNLIKDNYIKLSLISVLSLTSCDSDSSFNKENWKADKNHIKNTEIINKTINKNINVDSLNILSDQLLKKEEYESLLDIQLQLLDHYTKNDSLNEITSTYNKIWQIYFEQNELNKSLSLFKKALELAKKLSDKIEIIKSQNNIGKVFFEQNENSKAYKAYQNALKIYNDNQKNILPNIEITKTYRGMAWSWFALNQNINTLEKYIKLSTQYNNIIKDKEITELLYFDIADVKYVSWDIKWALKYLLEHEEEIVNSNIWWNKERLYLMISHFYKNLWNYEYALKYKNKEISIKDKRKNYESKRIQAEMEAKYESEKNKEEIKRQEIELEAKDAKLLADKKAKENLIIALIWASLTIGLFIYFNSKIKKNKKIIEDKNYELEEKAEETLRINNALEKQSLTVANQNDFIMSGIQYAKRIQSADLTPKEKINKMFPGNFVLYKPRELVSGDFYRGKEIGGKKFFAMLDSTWHWVPGAMLSSKWLTILNAISKENFESPADILKPLNTSLHEIRKNHLQDQSIVKDTMDGSIISYDSSNWELIISWSKWEILLCPNQELKWIKIWENKWFFIKEYLQEKTWKKYYSLKTQKKDLWKDSESPFKNHIINVKNATIYLYSDWYQDQFWWSDEQNKTKKFMKKYFRNLISEISNIPDIDLQKKFLIEKLEKRQGQNPQTDDITIVWIKLEMDKW